MTNTRKAISIQLTVEQLQDVADALYMAVGSTRDTDRDLRLWETYRVVRETLAAEVDAARANAR